MRRRARPGIRRKPRTPSKLAWLQERLGKFLEQVPRQFSEGDGLSSSRNQVADDFYYQSSRKKERGGESLSPPWAREMPTQNQKRKSDREREHFRQPLPWREEMLPPQFLDPFGWDLDMGLWGEREAPPWAPINSPYSRSMGEKDPNRRETRPGEIPYNPERFFDWEFMTPSQTRRNKDEMPWMNRPTISPKEMPRKEWEEIPSSYDETERLVQGQVKRYSPPTAQRRIQRRGRY